MVSFNYMDYKHTEVEILRQQLLLFDRRMSNLLDASSISLSGWEKRYETKCFIPCF